MASRTKVAATTEAEPVVEATTPKQSPAQAAGTARYNEAYLAATRLSAKAGPLTGEALQNAHYFARTMVKTSIASGDIVCPTCGGQKVAV